VCSHGLASGVDSQRSAAETESGRGLFRPRQPSDGIQNNTRGRSWARLSASRQPYSPHETSSWGSPTSPPTPKVQSLSQSELLETVIGQATRRSRTSSMEIFDERCVVRSSLREGRAPARGDAVNRLLSSLAARVEAELLGYALPSGAWERAKRSVARLRESSYGSFSQTPHEVASKESARPGAL